MLRLLTTLALVACASEVPEVTAFQPKYRVSLTFDELPYQVGRDGQPLLHHAATQKQISQQIIHHLHTHQTHATVFTHCDHLPPKHGILALWKENGHSVGNMGATHLDANTTPLDHWAKQIKTCATVLKQAQIQDPPWFRFPDLQRGWTPARNAQLKEILNQQGLIAVPASVPTADHLFHRIYQRALDRGNQPLAEEIAQRYIDHIVAGIQQISTFSKKSIGWDIPHILAMHVNRLNADLLDRLLHRLRTEQIELIPLHETIQDPVYAAPLQYFGTSRSSWLYRITPTDGETQDWFGQAEWRLTEQYPAALLEVNDAPSPQPGEGLQ